jgi:hypothetical protein
MTQTATLLVLFSGLLSAHEQKSLAHFAKQRGMEVIAPAPTPRAPYPRYRAEFVGDLEGRLDEARTLASSLDEERALVVLDALERDLLRSPELPQASFLLAERHRLAASVVRRQPDGATRVEALVAKARVLEGARAAAFGEPSEPLLPESGAIPVRFADLGFRDVLELDGEPGAAERWARPGLHHLRVLRAGELVWAGFVDVPKPPPGGRRELRLGVRPLAACSREDLTGVDARAASPVPPAGIACPRWLAVRRAFGRLEVADCSRSTCGSFAPVPDAFESRPTLPDWAKPVIAGAGTAGVVLGLLWATGAFSPETPPDRTSFVYRGPR